MARFLVSWYAILLLLRIQFTVMNIDKQFQIDRDSIVNANSDSHEIDIFEQVRSCLLQT